MPMPMQLLQPELRVSLFAPSLRVAEAIASTGDCSPERQNIGATSLIILRARCVGVQAYERAVVGLTKSHRVRHEAERNSRYAM